MEYYSSIKKRNFAICDNMDGLRGYYGSKINQTEKKVFGISHVQSKKYKQTNELVDT